MKKQLILTLSVLFLLTGCGWNPFAPDPEPTPTPSPTPEVTQEEIEQVRQELEEATGRTLPTLAPTTSPETQENGESPTAGQPSVQETVLRDQTGGDSRGFLTLRSQEQQTELTLLADLPTPEGQQIYVAWLTQGEPNTEDYNVTQLGQLTPQKGGYVVDQTMTQEANNYNQVVVSLEETTQSAQPGQTVLQGNLPQ